MTQGLSVTREGLTFAEREVFREQYMADMLAWTKTLVAGDTVGITNAVVPWERSSASFAKVLHTTHMGNVVVLDTLSDGREVRRRFYPTGAEVGPSSKRLAHPEELHELAERLAEEQKKIDAEHQRRQDWHAQLGFVEEARSAFERLARGLWQSMGYPENLQPLADQVLSILTAAGLTGDRQSRLRRVLDMYGWGPREGFVDFLRVPTGWQLGTGIVQSPWMRPEDVPTDPERALCVLEGILAAELEALEPRRDPRADPRVGDRVYRALPDVGDCTGRTICYIVEGTWTRWGEAGVFVSTDHGREDLDKEHGVERWQRSQWAENGLRWEAGPGGPNELPRHFQIALRRATQNIKAHNDAALGTIEPALQPLVDAAMARIKRAERGAHHA